MPGPGPGSCLRRGGGGRRAGSSAPSLTLRAPARCSISPSRLLLHLLLTARGGRQGAGAPGPARTPRLRPERLAPPHHWLGRQDQGAEPRRGDTGPGEEAGGRNAATYGDCPPRRAPLPRFPLLQPNPGLLRATGARRPEGRGLARLRAGSQAGASRGGGAVSPVGWVARRRGVSAAPRQRRPRSSLASGHWSPEIYPPWVLHSGTLLGRPLLVREGRRHLHPISQRGKLPSESGLFAKPEAAQSTHREGLFLALSPSSAQQAMCTWASHFPSIGLFVMKLQNSRKADKRNVVSVVMFKQGHAKVEVL